MPGDMVSDSNPIPVYPEMDQSNKTKLEAGLEGKKATEDSN